MIAAPVRWPQQPSASTVDLGLDVGAGLEVAQRLAVLAAALVARAHADDRAVLDDQLRRRGLGEDVGAGLLGLRAAGSGPAPTTETTSLPWFLKFGTNGIGTESFVLALGSM